MICQYCDEPILPEERGRLDAAQTMHWECLVRVVAGSAAHQLGECTCFGGTREDPPGMTLPQAAWLAAETFDQLQGAKV